MDELEMGCGWVTDMIGHCIRGNEELAEEGVLVVSSNVGCGTDSPQ
jgi:hypothetical protein